MVSGEMVSAGGASDGAGRLIPHQFGNQWGRLCSAGLHILIGTGIQGKPLRRRVFHAFGQVRFLEPALSSERSLRLLATVNELAGRSPGEGPRLIPAEGPGVLPEFDEGRLAAKIDQLPANQVKLLARYLCDFFIETYADERDSPKRPGGDEVIASGV
ncbi:MAG TPA: hypothetical protein VGF29_09885 [Hyphomicrobiaceae bacterium]|jgi:hypothetical protein